MSGIGFGTPIEPEGGGTSTLDTARRGSRRRNTLISAFSTVIFFALIAGLIALSPGANKVVDSFFSTSGFEDSFEPIAKGFWLNVKLMLVAEAFVLVLGLLVAVIRSLPGPVLAPLRIVGLIYTDVFRAIPLILVIFMVGLGLPALRLEFISDRSVFTYGVVALVLVYSAYVAEVYRAGIESVHPSQEAAARSLGLNRLQALRYVILPQAIRRVIPPLLNDFIGLQKDTALVALLGILEAFRQSQIEVAGSFNFTPYVATALIFLVLTIPMTRLTDLLIARNRRRELARA
jgi:polar amino acid transport system permease protein